MTPGIRESVSRTHETIYWPAERPPRGGIVCLHGSEGGFAGWNDLQCARFAACGFTALARNYTQHAQWPVHPDIDNAPLDGTEAALLALKEELASYRCGVGLFGFSRGAEHALLLAQLLAEENHPAMPDAIAVRSPPDAVWPAFIVADFQTGRPWDGDRRRAAWSWRGEHDRCRPGTPLAAASLSCPVFISQGAEDAVWGAEPARRLVTRLTESGHPPEAHFFEGEDHTFGAAARNRELALMIDFFDRRLSHA